MSRILPALLLLLLAYPSPAFAHTASEAEIIALEASGEILAPPALVAEVEAELVLIRASFPVLEWVYARPDWVPGELLMGLSADAYDRFQAGQHEELNALNQQLGLEDLGFWDSINACHLTFTPHYNPEFLVPDYEAIEGVRYAEPNHIGGDGPDITREAAGTYLFRYAWGDCPAGCIEEHFWEIRIVDGEARIQREWGDELPSVIPAEEHSFGALKSAFSPGR